MAERSFPQIDFAALRRGQTMPVAEVETILGVPYADVRFTHRIRSLVGEIKRNRPDLAVKTDRGAILILSDELAATHLAAQTISSMRTTVRRIHDHGTRVRRDKLPEPARRAYDAQVGAFSGAAVTIAGEVEKARQAALLAAARVDDPKKLG